MNNRINQVISASNAGPKVVAVSSGKGGSGKSVIALNLADRMSRQGIRTLLIDADWHFGNIHILSNTVCKTTLHDIVSYKVDPAEAIVELKPNLNLILSPSSVKAGIKFDLNRFAELLANLDESLAGYDLIVFDTPTGYPDIVRLISAITDINLVILNPELTAIANNYGLIKLLLESNKNLIAHILVNKAISGKDSEYIFQKLSVLTGRFLGNIPQYAGYLGVEQLVREAVEGQKMLYDLAPESTISGQFLTLCKNLTDELSIGVQTPESFAVNGINSEIILADIKE